MTHSNTQKAGQTSYKYRLTELEENLPSKAAGKFLKQKLKEKGISVSTWYRDKSIQIDSSTDINGERLLIYAALFDVEINELYTKKKETKSILEMYQEEQKENESSKDSRVLRQLNLS